MTKRVLLSSVSVLIAACSKTGGPLPCTSGNDSQCPAGWYCGTDSKCAVSPACPAPMSSCHGACVDLSSAVSDCGSCRNNCPGVTNGSPVCNSGNCDFTCDPSHQKVGNSCPTPVSAPVAISATPTDDQHISVTWNRVQGAVSYDVLRGTFSGGEVFVAKVPDLTSGATTVTFSNSSLSQGVSYYYEIVAHSSDNASPASNEVKGTTWFAAPTSFTAAPTSDTQAHLSWTQVSGATSYDVARLGGPTSNTPLLVFDASGLSPNTSYTFSVKAKSASNPSGVAAQRQVLTYLSLPGSPTPAVVSDTEIDFTWNNVTGATSYEVTDSSTSLDVIVPPGGVTTTTYAHTGLSGNSVHSYQVRAKSSSPTNVSLYTVAQNATTLISAPAAVTATAISDTKIDITWSASSGATAYDVFRGGTKVCADVTSTLICHDSGLNPNSTYTYNIMPKSASNTGVNGTAAATTYLSPPGSPALTVVDDAHITFAWSAATGADNYDVFRGITSGAEALVAANFTGTSFADSGLIGNQIYYYQVRAKNSSGNVSLRTGEQNATTLISAPATLTPTPISDTQIEVTWSSSSGATAYDVFRVGTTPAICPNVPDTSRVCHDNGRVANTSYSYKVAPKSSTNTGVAAGPAAATTLLTPVTFPSGAAVPVTDEQHIDLTFNKAPLASSYDVFHSSTSPSTGFSLAGNVVDTGASSYVFHDASLTANTTYYYQVQAKITTPSANTSIRAGTPSALTFLAASGAPTVTAVTDDQHLDVTFSRVAGATSYQIFRGLSSNGEGASPVATITDPGTGLTAVFHDASLTPGTTYYYEVQAISSNNNSVKSAEGSSTTTLLTPTLNSITPNPTTSPNQVPLSWSMSDGAGYIVYRSTQATSGFSTLGGTPTVAGNSTLSYSDTTPQAGTQYFYAVAAWTPQQLSANSPTQQAVTTLPAPSPLTAATGGGISLSWGTVTNATGYVVQRSSDGVTSWGTIFTGAGTNTTDTVSAGTTVYYRAYATNSLIPLGGLPTSVLPVTQIPGPPGGVSASPSPCPGPNACGSVQVTWSTAAGALGYNIYRSASSSGPFAQLGSQVPTISGGSATSYVDTNLAVPTVPTQYFYQVQSWNPSGTSPPIPTGGAPVTLPPVAPPLAAPTSLRVGSGDAVHITLVWNPGGGTTFVFRSADRGTTYSFVCSSVGNSCTDNTLTLTPATDYSFKAQAQSGSSYSAFTAPIRVVVPQLNPPTGLTATSGATQINLSWTAPTPSPSGYSVFSSTDGATWTPIAGGGCSGAVTGTSCADTTFTPGAKMFYTVQSTLSGGSIVSPFSTVATANATIQPPTGPSINGVSAGSISLVWSAPSGIVANYQVLRGSPTCSGANPVGTTPNTSFLDTSSNILASTTYCYQVAAIGADGVSSALSAPASQTTLAGPAPAAPGSPTLTLPSAGGIALSWATVSGAIGYNIVRSTNGSDYLQVSSFPTVTTTATTFTDTTVGSSTSYTYKVGALGPGGNGPYGPASLALMSQPAAPSNLVAFAGGTQVSLAWSPSPNATSYTIIRSTTGGSGYTPIGTAGGSAAGFTDHTNVSSGITYYYAVKATGPSGTSANSNEASATPGSNDVSGTWMFNNVTSSAESASAPGFNVPNIFAIPQGTTNKIFGLATQDGYFSVPGVPAGPYMLKGWRGRQFVFGNDRTGLDWGQDSLGRASAVTSQIEPTNIVLNTTPPALQSWQSTDLLEMFCPNNGLMVANPPALHSPLPGDTSLINFTFDNFQGPLLDPTQSDTCTVHQLSTQPAPAVGATFLALSQFGSASLPASAEVDGQDYAVNATLSAATGPGNIATNYKRSLFKSASMLAAVNPSATSGSDTIAIDSLLAAATHGLYAAAPDVLVVTTDTGTGDLNLGTLNYQDPFPASWGRLGVLYAGVNVPFLVPATTVPYVASHRMSLQDNLSTFATAAASLSPAIFPVSSPTIQGVTAFQDLSGTTTTPTLSWTAPSAPAPDFYFVSVFSLQKAGSATALGNTRWNFLTTATSFAVPPNLITPGTWYFAVIRSVKVPPSSFATQHPLRNFATYAQAIVVTNKFTP